MKTICAQVMMILILVFPFSIAGWAQVVNYPPTPLNPTISLTSDSLSFLAFVGGPSPGSQSVGISNAGMGTLEWSAGVTSGSWLDVSPTSGTGSGTLTISVNSTG